MPKQSKYKKVFSFLNNDNWYELSPKHLVIKKQKILFRNDFPSERLLKLGSYMRYCPNDNYAGDEVQRFVFAVVLFGYNSHSHYQSPPHSLSLKLSSLCNGLFWLAGVAGAEPNHPMR